MADENKTDDKIMESLNVLNKKIDEQATKHETKLSSIDRKIESLADVEDVEEEKKETWETDDDDDEVVVKKSELRTIVDTAVKKATDAATKAATKTVSTTLSANAKRQEKDVEAFKDFPYMNKQSEEYNERFLKEVTDEMQRRVGNGRSREDPELLYDSAAVINQRGRSQGWLLTQEDADRVIDRHNSRGESFSVTKRQKQDDNQPTPAQIEAAMSMGMKKEDFLKQYAKTSRGKINLVDMDE